jgi:hypothetical protein
MPKRDDRSPPKLATHAMATVPAGAPPWITPELIEHTLRVWQPFYEHQLIPEDALEIIMSVDLVAELLSSGGRHETIRSPGSREQP